MRLDNYLVQNGFFESRTKAKQAIERGEISIDGKIIYKVSFDVSIDNVVKRTYLSQYVSLGGFKLEKALKDFSFSVKNMVIADIGASTGGFTDCLIQNNAKKVYSIDLRQDLLHEKLLNNDKVVQIVKNAKELTKKDFQDDLDLIVADLSFISISQVVDTVYDLIDDNKKVIFLIKPQFEIGKRQKFKNGVIKDKRIHKEVCQRIYKLLLDKKLYPQKITIAPINSEKNIEFLILLEKNGRASLEDDFFSKLKFE